MSIWAQYQTESVFESGFFQNDSLVKSKIVEAKRKLVLSDFYFIFMLINMDYFHSTVPRLCKTCKKSKPF